MRLTLVLCGLAVIAAVTSVAAEAPRTISHQGLLRNADGTLVPDGGYDIAFALYDVETGGTALWSETHVEVPVVSGVFNVILGKMTALDMDFDVTYWLGLTIEGGAELTPRLELTSAPYTLRAAVADSALTGPGGGGGGNTLDQAYDEGGPGAGRTIAADAGAVQLTGPGGLVVKSDSGTGTGNVLLLSETESGPPPRLHFRNPFTLSDWVLRHDESKFHIQSNPVGDEVMTLSAVGRRVGIGITDPTVSLEVAGDVKLGLDLENNVAKMNHLQLQRVGAPTSQLVTDSQALYVYVDDTTVNLFSEQDENSGNRGGFRFHLDDDGTSNAQLQVVKKSDPGGITPLFGVEVSGHVTVAATVHAGSVHSSDGGFEFPDGTIQRSAAEFRAAASNPAVLIGPQSDSDVEFCGCPSGYWAMGGGWEVLYNQSWPEPTRRAYAYLSRPASRGGISGWEVGVANESNEFVELTVYVRCLKVGMGSASGGGTAPGE